MPPRSCLCTASTALMRTGTPACPATDEAVYSTAGRGSGPPSPSSSSPERICLHHQKQDANYHQSSFHTWFSYRLHAMTTLPWIASFPEVVIYNHRELKQNGRILLCVFTNKGTVSIATISMGPLDLLKSLHHDINMHIHSISQSAWWKCQSYYQMLKLFWS